ncbi:hypothetical protein D3C84_902370 [compost metagenome]
MTHARWKSSPSPTRWIKSRRTARAPRIRMSAKASSALVAKAVTMHLASLPNRLHLPMKSAKLSGPSTPRSCRSVATVITGKTGPMTLPKLPEPILTASKAFWKTPNTRPKKPLLKRSLLSYETILMTALPMARSSKCWLSI